MLPLTGANIHEILSRQPRRGSYFADYQFRFKIWNQRPTNKDLQQGRDR